MKLAFLCFDDMVVVPGWTRTLGGSSIATESRFTAADGWTLERLGDMRFRVWREDMPAPVVIEGYGASYVEAQEQAEAKPPKKARA